MLEFCDSASAEFCAEAANLRRISRRVQNWQSGAEIVKFCNVFSNIALSSALTAATASTKHFSVKVTKY